MIVSALLSHTIRTVCLSSLAFGMTAAVAQDIAVTHVEDNGRWTENVVAYNDPETEIGNGTFPPTRNFDNSETEGGDDSESAMESYNLPESEVGNGTYPPNVNP